MKTDNDMQSVIVATNEYLANNSKVDVSKIDGFALYPNPDNIEIYNLF